VCRSLSPNHLTPTFNDTCLHKKQLLLDAVMQGDGTCARDHVLKGYRAHVQRYKRHTRARRNTLLTTLFGKDPSVHKLLKKPTIKCVTPVSELALNNHLHNVFRHTTVVHTDNNASRKQKVWQGIHNILRVQEGGLAQFLAETTPFPRVADTTTTHNLMVHLLSTCPRIMNCRT